MPELNTKVTTGKVRFSYCHLFEPFAGQPDQTPKYSVQLLIDKKDTATLKKLKEARAAAIEKGRDKFPGGKVPANLKSTLHDGDEEADLERNPERAGCYYMTVSSNNRPGVVDASVQPILDAMEVYSGCYGRVSLNAYVYNVSGNRGVSFGLNNVQKLADGESLGGVAPRAEDDFEAVEIEDEGGQDPAADLL